MTYDKNMAPHQKRKTVDTNKQGYKIVSGEGCDRTLAMQGIFMFYPTSSLTDGFFKMMNLSPSRVLRVAIATTNLPRMNS